MLDSNEQRDGSQCNAASAPAPAGIQSNVQYLGKVPDITTTAVSAGQQIPVYTYVCEAFKKRFPSFAMREWIGGKSNNPCEQLHGVVACNGIDKNHASIVNGQRGRAQCAVAALFGTAGAQLTGPVRADAAAMYESEVTDLPPRITPALLFASEMQRAEQERNRSHASAAVHQPWGSVAGMKKTVSETIPKELQYNAGNASIDQVQQRQAMRKQNFQGQVYNKYHKAHQLGAAAEARSNMQSDTFAAIATDNDSARPAHGRTAGDAPPACTSTASKSKTKASTGAGTAGTGAAGKGSKRKRTSLAAACALKHVQVRRPQRSAHARAVQAFQASGESDEDGAHSDVSDFADSAECQEGDSDTSSDDATVTDDADMVEVLRACERKQARRGNRSGGAQRAQTLSSRKANSARKRARKSMGYAGKGKGRDSGGSNST